MRPNKEALEAFMRLYTAEFHEPVSEDEASEIWTRVMDLYLVLHRSPHDGKGNSERPTGSPD